MRWLHWNTDTFGDTKNLDNCGYIILELQPPDKFGKHPLRFMNYVSITQTWLLKYICVQETHITVLPRNRLMQLDFHVILFTKNRIGNCGRQKWSSSFKRTDSAHISAHEICAWAHGWVQGWQPKCKAKLDCFEISNFISFKQMNAVKATDGSDSFPSRLRLQP